MTPQETNQLKPEYWAFYRIKASISPTKLRHGEQNEGRLLEHKRYLRDTNQKQCGIFLGSIFKPVQKDIFDTIRKVST